jgi:hypothetical protein
MASSSTTAPGRPKAQARIVAARQHRREVTPVASDGSVARRVNPAVKGVEPARAEQAIHRGPGQAGVQELSPRHKSVLPSRNGGDRRRCGQFAAHIDVNSSHPATVARST